VAQLEHIITLVQIPELLRCITSVFNWHTCNNNVTQLITMVLWRLTGCWFILCRPFLLNNKHMHT